MADHVAAIDSGTTSSRCIVFDHSGSIVEIARSEHEQITPKPGWVEHDPGEIWANTEAVLREAMGSLDGELVAIGITNQRETAVAWDAETGKAIGNAIVWQDTRTDRIARELGGDEGPNRIRDICGLPLSTYFSGPKWTWMLRETDGLRERAEQGEVLFGTVDSFLMWNLTGEHLIDVTNASRTMLMDLDTLQWSDEALELMEIPRAALPEIRSSSEVYGEWEGIPVAGVLGDQQAALFGQTCFDPGDAKNTYGTGSFLLVNTGEETVRTQDLLTTVAYQLGDEKPVYALEGSIAVTGAAVQWLRDRLGIISDSAEVEALARTVEDNGGVYFVPAFSGLFAPYWRSDARGVIVGLSAHSNKGHLARATLEATAWQSREVVDAANAAADVPFTDLKADGGMTVDETLMQFQADVLGVPVIRPVVTETTCLGAAYAAGLATGFWSSTDELRENWAEDKRWEPQMDEDERERQYARWKKAVQRTLDWVEEE